MLKRKICTGEAGFSLLETLVALGLMAVFSAALLHSVAAALQARSRSDGQWRLVVKKWNKACEARILPAQGGELSKPLPDARPLRRVLLGGQNGDRSAWEVLRAEK